MTQTAILRRPAVTALTGLSASGIYRRAKDGLFTNPVCIGVRAVGWPASEIEAINSALIAAQPDDHIRALVERLHAARYPDGKAPANLPQPQRPIKPGRPRNGGPQ